MLLTGETGTGKELVARAIHDRSAQRDLPLIKVNCAAIPETLLESELFGHVRGAFTGATSAKKGRFALADGGTIFLDEIATRRRGRAGEAAARAAGAGVRAARLGAHAEGRRAGDRRHQPRPRQLVAEGSFQEDLYYRLNVIPIDMPPLRERREDMPALVEHFVQKFAQRMGKRIERRGRRRR